MKGKQACTKKLQHRWRHGPNTTISQNPGGGGGGWGVSHTRTGPSPPPPPPPRLAAPIGLSPLLSLALCGPESVLVVSTKPLDDLSYLTTLGSVVPETGCCPCR